MASTFDKFCFYFIINISNGSNRLFRSTNHTIVKGLRMDDRVNSSLDIAGAVHNNRNVSRTYTNSRISGGISSLYHARTACSKNHVYRFHQCVGQFNGRFFHPSDNAFRSSCLYCSFQNNLSSLNGTFFCTWMRADNNGISGF